MKIAFEGTADQIENLKALIEFGDNDLPKQIDFTSWHETHYEVVQGITGTRDQDWYPRVVAVEETQGTGGLYELAETLTDEFETLHEGKEWDGEFFDAIEEFLNEKLK